MTAIFRRREIIRAARDFLRDGMQVEIAPDGTLKVRPPLPDQADEHEQVSMK